MTEVGFVILWDATTRSTRNNDGQSDLHNRTHYDWKNFTGGYVNSEDCDPPWYVGKPGFYQDEGHAVARTFRTLAFFDKGSATHLYLKKVGMKKFLRRFLKASPSLVEALHEIEATNIRLERWKR